MSFSSSILLCFLLYVLFNVLEYLARVDKLRDNFETIKKSAELPDFSSATVDLHTWNFPMNCA